MPEVRERDVDVVFHHRGEVFDIDSVGDDGRLGTRLVRSRVGAPGVERADVEGLTDHDVPAIRAALATIPAICEGGAAAGALGRLSLRERFDWLVAPRSTIVQTSAVHSGRCDDLDQALEALIARVVRVARPER